jgi:hypothetical protein
MQMPVYWDFSTRQGFMPFEFNSASGLQERSKNSLPAPDIRFTWHEIAKIAGPLKTRWRNFKIVIPSSLLTAHPVTRVRTINPSGSKPVI